MQTLNVTSEIGRLRRVLVHEPGPEVDRMVPAMMEELLFDDILYGEGAREEHGRFRRVLEIFGAEILDSRDLLVQALGDVDARAWIRDVLFQYVTPRTAERMTRATPEGLAGMLVEGLRLDPGAQGFEVDELFEILPLPNWCFQRDPQMVVGNGVLLSSMATPARWREALLTYAIFRFHPELRSVTTYLNPIAEDEERPLHLGLNRPRFEGGDLLVLSSDVVLIGFSQRTNRTGVRLLARTLAAMENGPRWLGVVVMPRRRAFMHLDTIVTQIDRDACLVYPGAIEGSSSEAVRVFEIDLRSDDLSPRACDGLFRMLRAHGLDLEPIPCGGTDPVDQQREQWTDGANAFALAPGVVLMYDRNRRTAEELARHGFEIVGAEDLLLGRHRINRDDPARTCILLPSHELSRARGGPHCLTQPLVRDPA